jgi:hypothetical protein
MQILNSASKLVFIIMALALVGLTFKGIIEGKDFVTLVSIIFTYYFTKNNTQSNI